MPQTIAPYVAVALQPSFRDVRDRSDIKQNIDSIAVLLGAAAWLSAEYPVRLVALPEGVLQSFNDEITDRQLADYAAHVAIDVPGPETDALGALARQFRTYLIAQAKATDPDFPGYFFNVAIVIDPDGQVIHRAAKNAVAYIEGSCTPHDVYDRWVELHGNGLDAFFPVVDTAIGRIGTMICYEGMFPESARGLAMNGADIIYHPSAAVNTVDMGVWELANRARASDNNCYVIAPNSGVYHFGAESRDGLDVTGGHSMIVDYRGQVLARHEANTNCWAAAVIDIPGLRHFRRNATMRNFLKELRTEIYRPIYERPVFEKNAYLTAHDRQRAARIEWAQTGAERVFGRRPRPKVTQRPAAAAARRGTAAATRPGALPTPGAKARGPVTAAPRVAASSRKPGAPAARRPGAATNGGRAKPGIPRASAGARALAAGTRRSGGKIARGTRGGR